MRRTMSSPQSSKMHRDGIETVIVSDDKDMLQLVGPG